MEIIDKLISFFQKSEEDTKTKLRKAYARLTVGISSMMERLES
ncbi:MAG: hypothetical protein ACI9UJ_001549 [bacterium]|jgi:hypothetical protein